MLFLGNSDSNSSVDTESEEESSDQEKIIISFISSHTYCGQSHIIVLLDKKVCKI